jgi:4-methylaminobutanoate oxidase (formaldehyde-forming)
MDKAGGFVGRDALIKQKNAGLRKRLLQFQLKSPEPLVYHNEPIWQGSDIVGFVRSGMYAHTLGAAVGLGYITAPGGGVVGDIDPNGYEIEVAGIRYPTTASLRPLYDPKNERIKS